MARSSALTNAIAAELRKSLRKVAKLDDEVQEAEALAQAKRNELQELIAAVREYREALQGSAYDPTTGKPLEEAKPRKTTARKRPTRRNPSR